MHSPVDTGAGSGAPAAHWARPLATKARHLAVVGVLCLGIAWLLTVMQGGGFGNFLLYSLCIGLCCTLIVDGSRMLLVWLWDRWRRQRGLPVVHKVSGLLTSIPGAMLAMVAGPVLGFRLAEAISGNPATNLFTWESPLVRITLVLGVLGTVICTVLIAALERLATARAEAEAAQRQAAETQLRLLQSQLEPHMLFNTLANLRVLIGLQPQQAQQMLDHLINFLRATLNASRSPLHPLTTEFDRVADYLALMDVRMGPRLQVQLDLPDNLRGVPVPPLLLQPLVENAIKHGLEPQVAGGMVQVQARQHGAQLHLVVRDTGQGLARAAQAGGNGSHFGLLQIRQRLATLYGAAASLELKDAGLAGSAETGACATLVMPIPKSMPTPMPQPPPALDAAPPAAAHRAASPPPAPPATPGPTP